jgi:Cu(I)/Ag(I) efflux system membrane fusion protein
MSEADKAKEIQTAMAKLSPEDRALAEAQKVCPVSGEPLGSMGPPIALEVNGRKVFICCDSCRQPMADEPEKYLAKLPTPAETPAPAVSEPK